MSDCCEFISGHEQVIQHRFGRAATRHNGHSAASRSRTWMWLRSPSSLAGRYSLNTSTRGYIIATRRSRRNVRQNHHKHADSKENSVSLLILQLFAFFKNLLLDFVRLPQNGCCYYFYLTGKFQTQKRKDKKDKVIDFFIYIFDIFFYGRFPPPLPLFLKKNFHDCGY